MPGKTAHAVEIQQGDDIASMRPQRNAGENVAQRPDPHRSCDRFNEAPAKCRGKRPGAAR